jgi:hypothetical protein
LLAVGRQSRSSTVSLDGEHPESAALESLSQMKEKMSIVNLYERKILF